MLPTLLLAGALLAQGDDSGIAMAERAASAYQALSSFRADFRQVIDDDMLGVLKSKGRLVQSGTDRLAMRFADPDGEAIVMDGKQIWVYTPSTTPGQVLRLPIPSGPTFGPNVLAWLLERPSQRYRISFVRSDQIDKRAVDVIALVPLDTALPFRRAVLWLDRQDALPRRLEVDERSGTKRTLTLSALRVNGPVDDNTFRFAVPPGIRVVDQ
jgi:outer membrane lipoprotein carrier protein